MFIGANNVEYLASAIYIKREARGLTPMGHLLLAEHHSRDPHRLVSSLLSLGLPAAPQFQTYEPNLV